MRPTSAVDAYNDPEYGTTASPSPKFKQPSLPILSDVCTAYSGCCLSLSMPLLSYLRAVLPPPPNLVLSIGSGSGLLEALLLAEPYSLQISGVEVHPSPNRYLVPTHHESVSGTRFLHSLAAEAAAWLLVYPRRVGMVTEYLDMYGQGCVHTVVWVGPRADWEDYKSCFEKQWSVHVMGADEVGGRAWELIAVAQKRHFNEHR